MQDLQTRVADFVSMKIKQSPNRLSASDRLLQDLGVDGDDAAELMSDFAREFRVDMAEFHLPTYFNSEPNFFSVWFRSRHRKKAEREGKRSVTIGNLVDAARAGHWT